MGAALAGEPRVGPADRLLRSEEGKASRQGGRSRWPAGGVAAAAVTGRVAPGSGSTKGLIMLPAGVPGGGSLAGGGVASP
jgi:hypothetical protein